MKRVRGSVSLNLVAAIGVLFFSAPSSLSSPTYVLDKNPISSQSVAVHEEKIGGKTYQVSRVHVKAKPEQVWQLLADYDNAQYIFPCLKKCRLVKDRGRSKLVEQEISPKGVPGSFAYVLEIKETVNKRQEWHRISGDFHEVDGFWQLDQTDDGAGTLVTYASYVNGGFFIPQALIKRQVRIDIPSVMATLKAHVETSGQIASRRIESATRTP